MALFVPKNALQSATGGAQIKRYRDFAIVHFSGEGAIAVPNVVWIPAAAWATQKAPGNKLRDRGMLLMRLDTLVTRRGTMAVSTTGNHLRLAKLRDAMKAEGVEIKEWNFPPDSILDKALDPSSGKKPAEQTAEAAAEEITKDAVAAPPGEETAPDSASGKEPAKT
jgi:hypothetical protein